MLRGAKRVARAGTWQCRSVQGLRILSFFTLAKHHVHVQRRSQCTHTRPLFTFSSARNSVPLPAANLDETEVLSCSLETDRPLHERESTGTQQAENKKANDNERVKIAVVVRQLQALAAPNPSSHLAASPLSSFETNGVEGASADALAELMQGDALESDSALEGKSSEAQPVEAREQPAWQAGLQLAEEAAVQSAEIAEWLLFLALRSQEGTFGSPAPLEVCEGLYQAWRRHQTISKVQDHIDSSEEELHDKLRESIEASPSPTTIRSPFSPKGVHHAYATWLLREYHAMRALADEMMPLSTSASAAPAKGENYCGDSAGGDEYNDGELAHHACYLLNRTFEVLLLDLPHDTALSPSHHQHPDSPQQQQRTLRRSKMVSSKLRPTTALLVLEAARQLAQLHSYQHPTNREKGPEFVEVFPLLSFLLTPTDVNVTTAVMNARGGDSNEKKMLQLDAVAKAAFEAVLCTAPTHQKPTRTSKRTPHSLHGDAITLYLAYRMTAASPAFTDLTLTDVNTFVSGGSLTARQLSRPAGESAQDVDAALIDVGRDRALQSSSVRELAAAVRWVLSAYFAEDAARSARHHTGSIEGEDASLDALRNALTAALLLPVPPPLQPLLAVASFDDSDQLYQQNWGDEGTASKRNRSRPESWCAWLLRALFYELKQGGSRRDTESESMHSNLLGIGPSKSNNTNNNNGNSNALLFSSSSGGSNTRSVADTWPRQSEWLLALLTRLMVQLQQQVASTTAQQQQKQHQKHRHAHQRPLTLGALRRPLQEVWCLVFEASLQGLFFQPSAIEEGMTTPAPPRRPSGFGQCVNRTTSAARASRSLALPASASAAPVLRQLCYPYYDKTQWKVTSVNLYLRLLDQWGQGDQIRQVIATLVRREEDFQVAVQAAVRSQSAVEDDIAEDDGDDETGVRGHDDESRQLPSTPHSKSPPRAHSSTDAIFHQYRPALHLHSCLIGLKYCGCPQKVLAQLSLMHAAASLSAPADKLRNESSYSIHDGYDEDEAKEPQERRSGSPSQFSVRARLASQVLQYMLVALHVAEHSAFKSALRGNARSSSNSNNDALASLDSDDNGEGGEGSALVVEGLPLSLWVEWVGSCCVPAVEQLYCDAGLQEEWAAFGY